MRIVVLTVSALLLGCAHHGHRSSAPPAPESRPSAQTTIGQARAGVEIVFTEDEIRTIRAYYESHDLEYGSARGKGKKRSGGLPPGIAKNLARGKPVPPGIAQQQLPYDLRRQLPPAPGGHERIIVAGKILLVEIATQIVRDVLTEAVLG
jgi:hypothetical protein